MGQNLFTAVRGRRVHDCSVSESTLQRKSVVMKAIILSLFVSYMPVDLQDDDVRVCRDMSTYPEKIVIVCGRCQCPAGIY